MKKVIIILICLLAFGACLAIGILGGDILPSKVSPSGILKTPQEIAAIPTPLYHNQTNIIFIAVDSLEKTKPRLISILLLLYVPDQPTLTLMMLYPSTGQNYQELATRFKLGTTGEPDPTFTASLNSLKVGYQDYILIDEDGITQWIDWLGGVDAGKGIQDGAVLLKETSKPWGNLELAYSQQKVIISGICSKMSDLPVDTNWSELLVKILPDHMRTDLSLKDTVVTWQALFGSTTHLNCKIMTP
jgi:hypothetical protein